jgi:integrase
MPSKNDPAAQTPKTWGSTGITGLVLHIPTGTYYHRYSVKSKRTYRSLETKRFVTAKMKLGRSSETVEISRQARTEKTDGIRTLGDLEALFLQRLESTPQDDSTKRNYRIWLKRLAKVWPEFRTKLADRVTSETLIQLRTSMQTARFHKGRSKKWTVGYSPGSINQTLLVLKLLLDLAREKRVIFANPFSDDRGLFGRVFVANEQKQLQLPSHWDIERLFTELSKPPAKIANPSLAGMYEEYARGASEMARFLAYSGMRVREATAAQWEDIGQQRMSVRGTKSATSERVIPLIPAMQGLLDEMRRDRQARGFVLRGPILLRGTCLNVMHKATARLKIPRITQHGLRHYFATICIESGVDVPTVSRWLGHADGGAIAMRVYGHLRDEHSIAAAQKVSFGAASAPPLAPGKQA